MAESLFIRYKGKLGEDKINNEVYNALENRGMAPLKVTSDYFAKSGIFNVKYSFGKNNVPKISTMEKILNETDLSGKVEILNSWGNDARIIEDVLKVFEDSTEEDYWKTMEEISEKTGYNPELILEGIKDSKLFARNSRKLYTTRENYEKYSSSMKKFMDAFEERIR